MSLLKCGCELTIEGGYGDDGRSGRDTIEWCATHGAAEEMAKSLARQAEEIARMKETALALSKARDQQVTALRRRVEELERTGEHLATSVNGLLASEAVCDHADCNHDSLFGHGWRGELRDSIERQRLLATLPPDGPADGGGG